MSFGALKPLKFSLVLGTRENCNVFSTLYEIYLVLPQKDKKKPLLIAKGTSGESMYQLKPSRAFPACTHNVWILIKMAFYLNSLTCV